MRQSYSFLDLKRRDLVSKDMLPLPESQSKPEKCSARTQYIRKTYIHAGDSTILLRECCTCRVARDPPSVAEVHFREQLAH